VLSVSVRALWVKPIVNYLFDVCRTAGIGAGTTSVCSLHHWPHLTDRKPRSVNCFALLRRFPSPASKFRRSVPQPTFQSLMVTLWWSGGYTTATAPW